MDCDHPDEESVFLYFATNADEQDISVWRCGVCGYKFIQGA